MKELSPEQRVNEVEQIIIEMPEIAGIQAYERFRSDVNSQKDGFIAGTQTELELFYPDLQPEKLVELATATEATLRILMPTHDEKAAALYDAVEYRYAEMFMLRVAAEMQNPDLTEEQRQEAQTWFVQSNEALYSKPEPSVFAALAKTHLQPLLNKELSTSQTNAQQIRAELASNLGTILETDYQQFNPDQTAVDNIKLLLHERLGFMVDHVIEDKTYETADMAEALEVALNKIGGQELGWKVAVVSKSTALAVSAHQKLIEVGENRKPCDGDELKGKIFHEVGVHALRSINAEKVGWLSAAYGQEGYLDFEEAFATALEDAHKGKFADHGVDYYLIAGLAYGFDEHSPRDFRQVYEVMWRTNALKSVSTEEDITPEQIATAQSKAFTSCVRMFRGTTTTVPGVVYLKDLAYFNGQEKAWSVLAHVRTQADLDQLFAGKLDLTVSSHQHIASQILAGNA